MHLEYCIRIAPLFSTSSTQKPIQPTENNTVPHLRLKGLHPPNVPTPPTRHSQRHAHWPYNWGEIVHTGHRLATAVP
ncbi:hypothetical protein BX666DRAFT_1915824 [Dichotomocladium elegans]|nr:hypothetical protein BX666DRAFT_1915824 [Dichotomocladium elegans]